MHGVSMSIGSTDPLNRHYLDELKRLAKETRARWVSDQDLSQVQRWMQAVLMHPDGVVEGIQSESAQSAIPILADQIEEVILPSRRLGSIDRLEVYSNAYYARLLECLREEFSATVHFLGTETFDAFAFAYLQAYPSRSYTLVDLGAMFPHFLIESRMAEVDSPHGDISLDWSDFLIDVATLERTYSEVFSGPGIELIKKFEADAIANLSPEQFWSMTLQFAPCVRLMTCRFPVHEYISQFRNGQPVTVPDRQDTCLIITRRDFVVRRTAVESLEYDLLSMLRRGLRIGEAIECLVSESDTEDDLILEKLHGWFHRWSASGYFLSLEAG